MAQVAADGGRIEIELPDGTCVRVSADVGLVALRGGPPMIVPPTGVRVWLANGHTDMRRYAECLVMRSSGPGRQ